MSDLDRIFHEITEIRQQLDELPSDAFDERARLESRREALQAEVATLQAAGDERPTPVIQAELASLKQRLGEVGDAQIDIVSQHGGGALEASGTAGTFDLNKQIASAQGAEEIVARIHQLERVLEERGVTPA